jgi:Lipopolysaccharide-assembly
VALAITACRFPYHLNGGGLPLDIKSVAIIPFDNETASPDVQRELNEALRTSFGSRLGLKEASEEKASAVVRGRIVKYDLDVATGFSANPAQATSSRRQLQVAVHVEIIDQIRNRTLWAGDLTALGDYPENGEASGRKQAIDKIVSDVIQGAQSQW